MVSSIQKLLAQWRPAPYARFVPKLLLTIAAFVGFATIASCGFDWIVDCNSSVYINGTKKDVVPILESNVYSLPADPGRPLQPGERVTYELKAENLTEDATFPERVDLVLTLPPGATDIRYPDGFPPPTSSDGRTLVWKNVALHSDADKEYWSTDSLRVSFEVSLPPGQDSAKQAVSSQVIYDNDEGEHVNEVSAFTIEVNRNQSNSRSAAAANPPSTALKTGIWGQEAPTAGAADTVDDYYVWEAEVRYLTPATELTTARCQGALDQMQADTIFVGVRFPILDATPPYTGSHPLPVIFRGAYSASLSLRHLDEDPPTTVLTAPLEYKPERLTFLETELPSAEGENWLALGLPSSPRIDCPEGLDLGVDDWEVLVRAWLDFGGEQNACSECVLPLYYCYEGQTPPQATLLGQTLGTGTSATSYQGWGITCLGPQPLRLTDWFSHTSNFELHLSNMEYISPTQRITMPHWIWNWAGEPRTISLDHESTLDVTWTIYSGTEVGPDLPLVAITEPFELAPFPEQGSRRDFWISTEVLSGTADGPYTLFITATDVTSPALQAWTSDLLWVGDWIVPPAESSLYRVYLPLLLSNYP